MEKYRDGAAQSDRYRQQRRQLSAQCRADQRRPDSRAFRRAPEGNWPVDEGERRSHLRHHRQPIQRIAVGPLHQEGDQGRRDFILARFRLAERRKTAGAGAEEHNPFGAVAGQWAQALGQFQQRWGRHSSAGICARQYLLNDCPENQRHPGNCELMRILGETSARIFPGQSSRRRQSAPISGRRKLAPTDAGGYTSSASSPDRAMSGQGLWQGWLIAAFSLLWSLPGLGSGSLDVGAIDRQRVLRAANAALTLEPITITQLRAKLSEGRTNDFYSNGDYWWPDPSKPDGLPYLQRDGESNPQNFSEHRRCVAQLRDAVAALGAAYKLTGEDRYAAKAAERLRA